MKLVKMSLAAAMLVGASAYAEVKNVKFDGYAKVWYQTLDKSNDADDGLFEQKNSIGDVSVNLGVSADVADGMKFTAKWQILDTMGLESDVVGNRTTNATRASGDLTTKSWASDMNIAYTADKTTVVVGRQQLDTPLLFTEKWNSAYNTFDAVAVVNKSVENLTLVGAYVGKHNGTELSVTGAPYGTVNAEFNTPGSRTDSASNHQAFGAGAVYATKELKVQGWYYDVNSLASAIWADAEFKMAGLFVGVQYGGYMPVSAYSAAYDDSALMGAKIGYTIDKTINVYGAYTTTDDTADKGALSVANFATGDKSKAYTQNVFTDGYFVGMEDTDSWKIGGSYKMEGVKIAASYGVASQGKNSGTTSSDANKVDRSEFDLIVSGKVGGVDMKVIYLNQDVDYDDASASTDFDQDAIRIVATLPF